MNKLGAGGHLPPVLGVAPGAPASHPGHSFALPVAYPHHGESHPSVDAGKNPGAWMPVRPAAPRAPFGAAMGQTPDDTRNGGAWPQPSPHETGDDAAGKPGVRTPNCAVSAAERGRGLSAPFGGVVRAWCADGLAIRGWHGASLKLARGRRSAAGAFSGVA